MSINLIATVKMLELLNKGDVSAKTLLQETGFADIKVIYRWLRLLQRKQLVYINRWSWHTPYYSWNSDGERNATKPRMKSGKERSALYRARLREQARLHGCTLAEMKAKRKLLKDKKGKEDV